jgi:hypothetical protein
METEDIVVKRNSSPRELALRENFAKLFRACPIPENEFLTNLGLFLNRQTLSRILFMHELYKRIIDVHGIVVEFGVRWGQNVCLFESFRGMYEPYNYNRKVVGFDTFAGFSSVHPNDHPSDVVSVGAYAVSKDYEEYLQKILSYHEEESPLSHIRKYELVKGDVGVTVARYLEDNPETIIALAYFDLDLYEPTKVCLEAIRGHLTRGSVLGFDELNSHDFPGETLALKEALGLDRLKISRSPLNPAPSYIVLE